MFATMKIGTRISLGFALVILLVLAMGGFAMQHVRAETPERLQRTDKETADLRALFNKKRDNAAALPDGDAQRLYDAFSDVNSSAEALAGASEEVSATAQALSQAASEAVEGGDAAKQTVLAAERRSAPRHAAAAVLKKAAVRSRQGMRAPAPAVLAGPLEANFALLTAI